MIITITLTKPNRNRKIVINLSISLLIFSPALLINTQLFYLDKKVEIISYKAAIYLEYVLMDTFWTIYEDFFFKTYLK